MTQEVFISDCWTRVTGASQTSTVAAIQLANKIGVPPTVEIVARDYQPFDEETGVEIPASGMLTAAQLAALVTTATATATSIWARARKGQGAALRLVRLAENRAAYATQSEPTPLNTTAYVTTHTSYVSVADANTKNIAMLGDSLAFRWTGAGTGLPVWETCLALYPNLTNYGINSDNTQGVLWRVANGLFPRSGTNMKVVILQVGTNNTASAGLSVPISDAIIRICKNIKANMPWVRILLQGILPRSDATRDGRSKEVNAILATRYREIPGCSYHDYRTSFTNSSTNGDIITSLYEADGLHLSTAGYAVLANLCAPTVKRALELAD